MAGPLLYFRRERLFPEITIPTPTNIIIIIIIIPYIQTKYYEEKKHDGGSNDLWKCLIWKIYVWKWWGCVCECLCIRALGYMYQKSFGRKNIKIMLKRDAALNLKILRWWQSYQFIVIYVTERVTQSHRSFYNSLPLRAII